MNTIGERLKSERVARGLTLEAAAALANTTKQSLSQIERGITQSPSGLALEAWSRAYGVNLRWLTTGKGPRTGADDSAGQPLEQESQPPRIDPDILAASIKLIRMTFEILGVEFNQEEDGEPTALAYAYLLERDQRSITADNVVDFSKFLKAKMQGDSDDTGDRSAGEGHRGTGSRRRAS